MAGRLVLFAPGIERAGAPLAAHILARGRACGAAAATAEEALCALFGMPAAAVAASGAAAELPGVRAGAWLRCDPVHLLPDMAALRLFWGRELALGREEARLLAAAAEPAFADVGGRLHVAAPHRWYLALGADPGLRALAPRALHGTDISRALPAGADALAWHRRMNEVQVLLHDHPVNRRRREAGLPEVNGVWPWGGGRARPAGGWAVVGGEGLAAVLGAAAGARVVAPGEAVEAALTGAGRVLVAVWPGEESPGADPAPVWDEVVEVRAGRIRAALRRGRLEAVELHGAGRPRRLGRAGAWLPRFLW